MVSIDIEQAIDRLQARYAAALDGKRMQGWYDSFAARPDSSYVCTTAENVAAKLPVALMLDDNRDRLADRVTFVQKVWAGTFQDYRTRHLIQRLECEESADGVFEVNSNFIVTFTPEESGDSRLLVCGAYQDVVVREGAGLCFLHKRAVMDTIVLPRYVVYPI
ncbi:MAG TPA: aromatic-ring-hydroxylating dioxygenase subunit beta [Burkholderiaceae bacterium]|jgi:3-phenylpropionate/cinnamic acid dioxygenase small subunit